MKYPDRFLAALGAWQNGWQEDRTRRLRITEELQAAIGELPSPLPTRSDPPLCYRKRFLKPRNPENDTEMTDLVLNGQIHDGVASWSTDSNFWRLFKNALRDGYITAVFAYQPAAQDIIVDIPFLWEDPDFVAAVKAYRMNGGNHALALERFRDTQAELVLNVPLMRDEICGFAGPVGTYDQLFETAGATTEEAQDSIWEKLTAEGIFPGQARFLSAEQAQNVLQRTQDRMWALIERTFGPEI